MKIAVFSDLHGHNFRTFDRKTDRTGSHRLDKIVDTLLYIRDDCVRRGIKYVLFGGDMFEVRARVNTVVYNAIYNALKSFHEHGLEVIGIAGNHDQVDNSDVPDHSLMTFNDLPGVTIYGDTDIHFIKEDGEYVDIYCVPYSKNAQRIKDWIASQEMLTFSSTRICLFHLGISGAFVGSGSYPMADAFDPEDLRPDFFKYIVGGHFHRKQKIGGYENFMYTGAPIQHSFGDEGEEKGYLILDTRKRLDIQFVPIPNPMFLTMTLADMTKEKLQGIAGDGHYVRAMLKEDEVQAFNAMVPEGLQYKVVLEKVYEEQTRVAVKIGMTEEEVVTKYAQEHNPQALDIGLQILAEVKGNGRA